MKALVALLLVACGGPPSVIDAREPAPVAREAAHWGTRGCAEELDGSPATSCPASGVVGCCSCAPGEYSCVYLGSGEDAEAFRSACGGWLCGDSGTASWSEGLP